ncbi:BnaC01g32730D [Brassica napus]|uniref:BnaC01g32730D protein n=1 Tax=Brassica napus TaxID=3708 RepID=A0A078IM45_BRANA|nr:BnaC01g32730D [Brassica napus]
MVSHIFFFFPANTSPSTTTRGGKQKQLTLIRKFKYYVDISS